MKFSCDKCQTKYSIADERVHGRVLKIRCKSCNNVITVREEPAAKPAAASMSAALGALDGEEDGSEHTVVSSGPGSMMPELTPPGVEDEWYVSFDGEQEGPFPLSKAVERVRSEQPKGREIHCWRPGFFVWLPVEEVPDFQRAMKNAAKSSLPGAKPSVPVPAKSGSTTGGRPAIGAKKDPTGPLKKEPPLPAAQKPVVSKDPTGPRAALGVSAPKEPTPLAPLDSKPMPLPPPPEMPSPVLSPMGSQATRPETAAAYRRTTGSHAAVAKGGTDGPAKKPAFPSSRPSNNTGPKPAFGKSMSATRTEDARAAEANGFAAALASGGTASAVDEHRSDTGPVPLPPPPGDELPIGEASGLLNLSHLKPGISGVRPPLGPAHGRGPVETFGGVPVTGTPTPGSAPNGTMSGASPVVVVTGPAPAAMPPWMKAALIGGVATIAALACVVVYLVTRPPVVKTVEVETPSRKLNDSPIAMADPDFRGPQTGNDPKRPATKRATATAARPAPQQPKADPNKGLSSAQRNLANLYGEESGQRELSLPSAAQQRRGGGNVNEAALGAVVQQNKPAMSLCYQRVLKHDPSLKSAKIVAHVKIGISGRVTNVSFNDATGQAEIGQCLAQSIKRWNFPSNDSEYDFEFPIVLTAQ